MQVMPSKRVIKQWNIIKHCKCYSTSQDHYRLQVMQWKRVVKPGNIIKRNTIMNIIHEVTDGSIKKIDLCCYPLSYTLDSINSLKSVLHKPHYPKTLPSRAGSQTVGMSIMSDVSFFFRTFRCNTNCTNWPRFRCFVINGSVCGSASNDIRPAWPFYEQLSFGCKVKGSR